MPPPKTDLYAVLGVLPKAEPVVVTAAYRALAQKYHPDRWAGDPKEAHERMTVINAAYATLSDSQLRAQYDRTRDAEDRSGFSDAQRVDPQFDDAIGELSENWAIACEIYPDLNSLRDKLKKVSISLAFVYTSLLLTSKRFAERQLLAEQLEQSFLERYFSKDKVLLDFARKLILANQRPALLALNKLVDVVGTDDEPSKLIKHIEVKFNLSAVWEQIEKNSRHTNRLLALIQRVKYTMDYEPARELATLRGYEVGEIGNGLFRASEITVSAKTLQLRFPNKPKFVVWVRSELCN